MIPIEYYGQHVEVGSALKESLSEKLGGLEKYAGAITSARAVIRRSTHHRQGDVLTVRISLETARGPVTAELDAPDVATAIDLLVEKLEAQLQHRNRQP
jgi:ribosomal subunit interface protein